MGAAGANGAGRVLDGRGAEWGEFTRMWGGSDDGGKRA